MGEGTTGTNPTLSAKSHLLFSMIYVDRVAIGCNAAEFRCDLRRQDT
jgi:hypothetical protein